MAVLFCDVDGTLIDYNDSINQPLVESIKIHLRLYKEALVVWSGGGEWYAYRWASKAFPDIPFVAAAKTKDIHISKDDWAIDDMHLLAFGDNQFTPEEFIKAWS